MATIQVEITSKDIEELIKFVDGDLFDKVGDNYYFMKKEFQETKNLNIDLFKAFCKDVSSRKSTRGILIDKFKFMKTCFLCEVQ